MLQTFPTSIHYFGRYHAAVWVVHVLEAFEIVSRCIVFVVLLVFFGQILSEVTEIPINLSIVVKK